MDTTVMITALPITLAGDTGRHLTAFVTHKLVPDAPPPDEPDRVATLADFPAVAVIEEHSCVGGLGAQVKQIAWDSQARCKLKTYSLKDQFIHFYGSQRELWSAHGLDEALIYSELAAL